MNTTAQKNNKHLYNTKNVKFLYFAFLMVGLTLSFLYYKENLNKFIFYKQAEIQSIIGQDLAKANSKEITIFLKKVQMDLNLKCILAYDNNEIFYKKSEYGECQETFLTRKVLLSDKFNNKIKIEFYISLPAEINKLYLYNIISILLLSIISMLIIQKLTDFIINEKNKGLIAFNTLARQVAHDIRSPLSALDMIVATNPESLPLAEKQIFNSAIKRIHDIANNLLIKGKTHDNQNTVENKKENTVFHLPTILESIISEKRAEFRQYNLLSIDFNINENNFDIFTSIDAVELKRIISNLINNSNEASKNECKILITLRKDDTSTILTISDNGPGIPNEVLQKINSNESITTKALGNGLGLKNARETILSNHGDFKIENHHGSIITITLPHISTPLWFLDKINLLQEKIIIIDDEISIFQAWQKRFDGKNISHLGGFEIFNNEEANYFIDYEFSTKDYNGLDKIIEHKIKNAVLVTSHFEDESIQAKCIKNNIKIIPKNLIPFITIVEKENSLIVLIDDDDLIHLVWKKEAKKRNINLIAFKSVHDFLSSSLGLDKNINIYIDSNLGESQKGEELSKNIFEKGFENIYLCSGDNQIELKKYPWIKGMSGKGFPTYNFQT